MALPHRPSILEPARLCVIVLGLALQACGLVADAIQLARPLAVDELGAICARGRLQVGMAIEPLRPFVFPAIWTDEGSRVTGLDVELVREITASLTKHCGGSPITPVLHLVHFRDLFVELNEGKLDLFVSAVSANVPSPARAGLAYSIPYYDEGGLTGITRKPEVAERVRAHLLQHRDIPDRLAVGKTAVAGLTVAVQEGRDSHLYAAQNLPNSRLVLCDSLPAALESEDPPIDVILGGQPILTFMVTRVRKDWRLLGPETGIPLMFTREHYAVVMAEESYRLRWFVNDVLFQLDQSGRLAQMRRRWLEEQYAYPRRAATEGLPFDVEKMVAHYDQGRCRVVPGR